ncbi:imelysin family protein [Litoribrevibacter euphylliae]|uniref:Imelysin family protein n=1 Tax=Litoribrevibacter euphylliae TaxID=1834034 RepID=A0ABV7HI37_9GAMM
MKALFVLLFALTGWMLSGCSEDAPPPSSSTQAVQKQEQKASPLQADLTVLAEHSFRQTTELLHLGHQLHISIRDFLKTPSEQSLTVAKQAYSSLLQQWVQSLPYINMTALTTSGAPLMNRLEKLPMLPGYLDQIPDYPFSGLVHDIMLPIESDNLMRLHTLDNDEQVIFGLSAIEFLLFDHYQADHYKKFLPMTSLSQEEQQEQIQLEQLPNNRRRALLLSQANQLVEDLSELHKRWLSEGGDDSKRLISLTDKNLKLALSSSLKKNTQLILDALNSVQEKPLMLGRAHFSREEKALLNTGVSSLKAFHESIQAIWQAYPQTEKDEFDGVLESLLELHEQYTEDPSNSLLLELASNRCNQLLEISDDLSFEEAPE